MKKLNILKTTLDINWYLSLLFLFILIFFLPMYLFSTEIPIPVKIGDKTITSGDIYSKLIVVVGVFSGLIFIYSIYLLRNVVTYFQKRDIFNPEVIFQFNKIGKLIIASTLLKFLALFIYSIYQHFYLHIKSVEQGDNLDFGNYGSYLISISLGLFFMVISEVFKMAKELKEENDLTV